MQTRRSNGGKRDTPSTLPDSANITRVSGNNPISSGNWTCARSIPCLIDARRRQWLGLHRSSNGDDVHVCSAIYQWLDLQGSHQRRGHRQRIIRPPQQPMAPLPRHQVSGLSPGDLVRLLRWRAASRLQRRNRRRGSVDPIPAPEADPINVWFGDSYPSSGPTHAGAWPQVCRGFGIPNSASGVGRRASLRTGGAPRLRQSRGRSDRVTRQTSFVRFLNDNGQGAAAVQAAVPTPRQWRQRLRNALIAWFGIEHFAVQQPFVWLTTCSSGGFAAAGLVPARSSFRRSTVAIRTRQPAHSTSPTTAQLGCWRRALYERRHRRCGGVAGDSLGLPALGGKKPEAVNGEQT